MAETKKLSDQQLAIGAIISCSKGCYISISHELMTYDTPRKKEFVERLNAIYHELLAIQEEYVLGNPTQPRDKGNA